uniref:thiol oxidase n=1 Tax=viral metagenome TaxID=1070528 RepID=A0A6C0GZE6_9ZZZZ
MSNRRINISPNFWGPKGWFFIDSIVLSYPDSPSVNDKNEFYNFLMSLRDVLPCEGCRHHFKEYINKHPLSDKVLASKKYLIKWILDAHNHVRKNQNKKQISLKEFYDYYTRENKLEINEETSEVKSLIENFPYLPNYTSVIGIICIFIILYLLIAAKKKWY